MVGKHNFWQIWGKNYIKRGYCNDVNPQYKIYYNFRALRAPENSSSCGELACFAHKKVRFTHIHLLININIATTTSNIKCLSPPVYKNVCPPCLWEIFVPPCMRGANKLFVPGGQAFYAVGGGGHDDEEIYVSKANFLVSEAHILVSEASKLSAGARISRGP